MLSAMQRRGVDHVPCSIYFNANLEVPGYDLKDPMERVRLQADLGADPVIDLCLGRAGYPGDNPVMEISAGRAMHPAVETRVWIEESAAEGHPVLYKEYRTPDGVLRHGVRHTPDWPFGMDIPWDDHTASNTCEPLVKSPEDVDAFAYIWRPPNPSVLDAVRQENDTILRTARDLGIAVRGYAGNGLATVLFVMGAENAILFAVDHPEAFKRLAEMDSETNIARIRLCAEAGADFVKRFGGYEQTNFYSPGIYQEVVIPLLKREVAAAHEVGLPIYYRVVTGMEPLLDDIASVGFDCIEGGEPHLSGCSLEMWHQAFDGRAASWTGVSSPALLGGDDPEAVRREVRRCFDVFGRTGFILGVTNSIRNHFPWKNTLAMIDEWKSLR